MAEGKTTKENTKITEVPKGKPRMFKDRSPVTIEVPEAVKEETEGCPDSIVITPMTRMQAVARERLKKKLDRAEKKAVVACGVKYTEYIGMNKSVMKLLQLANNGADEDEVLQYTEEHNKKYSAIAEKLYDLDDTEKDAVEDELIENAVLVVVNNCKELKFSDREDIEVTADTIECIHVDLFRWILKKIEEESNLTSGEVTSF